MLGFAELYVNAVASAWSRDVGKLVLSSTSSLSDSCSCCQDQTSYSQSHFAVRASSIRARIVSRPRISFRRSPVFARARVHRPAYSPTCARRSGRTVQGTCDMSNPHLELARVRRGGKIRCKENDLEQVGMPVPVPLGSGTDSEVKGGRGVSSRCPVVCSSTRIARTKSAERRKQEGPGSIAQHMCPHRNERRDGHNRTSGNQQRKSRWGSRPGERNDSVTRHMHTRRWAAGWAYLYCALGPMAVKTNNVHLSPRLAAVSDRGLD
jgi:hypothetical protein